MREYRLRQGFKAQLAQAPLRDSFPNGWSPSYPGFGAIVGGAAAFYDGLTPLFSPTPSIWDYTLNLGFYVTEAWLDLLRMAAKMWYSTTPQARGVIEALADYVVHTGFDYRVQAKPGLRVNQDTVKRAQRVVDDFLTKNRFYKVELDYYTRLHRDGEAIPRLFPQDSGITTLTTIEGWQVRSPGSVDPEWLFGVHTEKDNREAILGYNVSMRANLTDSEVVGADEMLLIKCNTDLQVKRGVSDFLATQSLFEGMRKLQDATLGGEAVRQAIAYLEQYSGTPAANIPPPTPPDFGPCFDGAAWQPFLNGGGNTQDMAPGTIPQIDRSLEFVNAPVGHTDNGNTAVQMAGRALSVYFRIPEWMVLGTSDANFAQALVQESPLVRRCEREQKLLKMDYTQLLQMVLRIAEVQGELDEGACDKLDFDIQTPPLVVRDAYKDTERHEKLARAGQLSGRTWSEQEDLDYEVEQENIKTDGPVVFSDEKPELGAGPSESNTTKAEYSRLTNGRQAGGN